MCGFFFFFLWRYTLDERFNLQQAAGSVARAPNKSKQIDLMRSQCKTSETISLRVSTISYMIVAVQHIYICIDISIEISLLKGFSKDQNPQCGPASLWPEGHLFPRTYIQVPTWPFRFKKRARAALKWKTEPGSDVNRYTIVALVSVTFCLCAQLRMN